jgi:hypothetical protein
MYPNRPWVSLSPGADSEKGSLAFALPSGFFGKEKKLKKKELYKILISKLKLFKRLV